MRRCGYRRSDGVALCRHVRLTSQPAIDARVVFGVVPEVVSRAPSRGEASHLLLLGCRPWRCGGGNAPPVPRENRTGLATRHGKTGRECCVGECYRTGKIWGVPDT